MNRDQIIETMAMSFAVGRGRTAAGPREIKDAERALTAVLPMIRAGVLESRAEIANRRMCVNCGKYAPKDHDRTQPLPECVDKEGCSACTFDMTAQEAWQHWRQIAHDQRAEMARLTKERDEARAEIADSKLENGYVIGWNAGWDEAFQRLKFPTMLRKMWSGGEVQRWFDERRAEQIGPFPGPLSERMFAAEARVAELERVAVDVMASLAAAISLLERGGKKAAASDKMFEQMLVDYNASLDRARAALRREET